MPDYQYSAIDTAGRLRHGRVTAGDDDAARSALLRQKLFATRLQPAGPSAAAPRQPGGSRRKLSPKQLTLFTRQVATLVQVAPLEEAIRTIVRQTEQPHVQQILERVHAGIVEGRPLSAAMALAPNSFPPLYRAMVAAGESSSSLPEILERLAMLQERQATVRGKVMAAVAYPAALAVVAVAVVIALMVFVVPKVVAQFEDIGQQLPLLTRIVIALSDFLSGWWWALLLFVAGAGLAFARLMRDEVFRLRFDTWLLGLPLIGRLLRDLHAARLARTLATMVASRLPLIEGLALTTPTINNRALRQASQDMVVAIREGGSLSVALRRSGLFPPLLVYMAAGGETSGRLDLMLERAADYLEREFDTFTATALSLLEPGVIILMGGIVAAIVLSILLPILQLDTLAAQ
ncbi:type II secretion system inner membrane protein GspF [Polymorphobacter fuscus]|uniref:General secretion pathway protein F n=1 Tax=Sandarakinorhabdus fusca TaxID=1439888 RepID=A0A7C9GWI2_9SPHN|nr:type II secretion system inner membrane protein GspF [Polymorphobacter fuscus]KAB7648996.1 type II secretion system protein GspF [Polymorphobacter fuscus]MQT16594.1 type II secretion system protein GspF [Polymorphobacter fuscus]NJC07116.1 general secretion pathway protein F [Polymorphobacter fuscus]